jgi:hypothetical protein
VGSIKLLEAILTTRGQDEETVTTICAPLFEIHGLRSDAGVAHRGGELPEGNLREHYRDLITRTSSGMLRLSELIQSGIPDCAPRDPIH